MIKLEQKTNKSKMPLITLICCLTMIFLNFVPQDLFEILIFNQSQIREGKFLGLITSHFIHVDFEHLSLNLLATVILGSIIESFNPGYLVMAIIVGIIGVDIFLISSGLNYYCGFSGVLNSLLIFALAVILQQRPSHKKFCKQSLKKIWLILKINIFQIIKSAPFSGDLVYVDIYKDSKNELMTNLRVKDRVRKDFNNRNKYFVILIFVSALTKIISEIYFGSFLSNVSWKSAPISHLAGFISAIIALLILQAKDKIINKIRG